LHKYSKAMKLNKGTNWRERSILYCSRTRWYYVTIPVFPSVFTIDID